MKFADYFIAPAIIPLFIVSLFPLFSSIIGSQLYAEPRSQAGSEKLNNADSSAINNSSPKANSATPATSLTDDSQADNSEADGSHPDNSQTDDSKSKEKKGKKQSSPKAEKQQDNSATPSTPHIPRLHEEVLVTATMSPLEVKNCSVSATVISSEKLRALDTTSALNALLYEPGIFVMRTGDFGRSDVEIRGLGQRGQRIGVMVDGRPEKMGLFGCVVTQAFPFDNVERLEVVRGPASVFYGSDALGGVVNIITHTPHRGFETEATSSYGTFDTWRFNLHHGAGFEKFSYYLTYDLARSNGHLANSAYSGDSLTGKFIYKLSSLWTLALSGKYYDGHKDEPTIFFVEPPDEYWFDYKRGAADLSLSRLAEKTDFSFKLYTDFGRHHFSDGWNSRDKVYGSILKYTFSGWKNNQLTAGTDFRYLGGQSYGYPVGQWHRSEGGFFVYDQFTIKDRLILTGGMRLNIDSIYGQEFVPSAGLVFFLTSSTSVRGLVSKGFRSPQLNELYLFPASNPDLRPEILWNYEAGFNTHFLRRFDLGFNFFLMNGHDFIQTNPNPEPPPPFKMVNIATYRARGIEASLTGELYAGLTAKASMTLLDPEENTMGKAKQKYDFSVFFSQGRIFGAVTAQYVTDYYAGDNNTGLLPSFFLLNGKLELDITRYFSILISLNNILDTHYQIFVNLPEASGPYPMPGRSLNLGLRIKP